MEEGEGLRPPSSTVWTKAVNDGRLVGATSAFVLPDICYTSPAASWRRADSVREQCKPVSDPLCQPPEVLSDPSGTLACRAAGPQRRSHGDETPCTKPCRGLIGWEGAGGAGWGGAGQGPGHVKKKHASLAGEAAACWGWGARTGGAPRGRIPSPPGSRLVAGSACLPPHFFLPPGPPLSSRPSIWPCAPGPQLPAGRPPGPLAVRLSVSGWFCCSTA